MIALPGCDRPEQAAENAAALDVLFPEETFGDLDRRFAPGSASGARFREPSR